MSDAQKIVAEIALDDAIQKTLDYQIPLEWIGRLYTGMRVMVPVRGKKRQGTVVSLKENSPFPKLASIADVISDQSFLPPDLFTLARWISQYYCTDLSKVIKTILPSSIRGKAKAKEQLLVVPSLSSNQLAALCDDLRRTSPPQAHVIDALLKSPKGLLLSELLETAQVSRSPIDTLIKKKIVALQKVQIDRSPLTGEEYFPTKPKILKEEQKETLDKIRNCIEENRFEVRLIHGITGSGKTEVYLQAIETALHLKKGVLFLVPEIALTSQMIERVKGRFQEKIAILHHRLSQGERHDAWHHIRSGNAPIVIGARSAVFSPIPNLGLIIVDEEHEASYKQSEESPPYHARDVAVMRGKIANAAVLLGTATPSLESYQNAMTGKYQLSCMKNRANNAYLPDVTIVDMKVEMAKAKRFTLFSAPLLDGIKKRVSMGEQVMLFLNRRGYHTSQLCLSCSHVIQCPHCEMNLTFHLGENVLSCHLCSYQISPPPKQCPQCHASDAFKFKGAGTEMAERALHAIFPEVRTLRLDADTTRHKGSHELLFKQFRAGKADVLIGTQMIAKGLHFPSVTLVGVLNADSSLQIPDFRASETVFQLLTQVAGRSGRGDLRGEVIIQTHLPDHPVIAFAKNQDYEGFFAQEIGFRELLHYPPFTSLVKIATTGKEKEPLVAFTESLRETLVKKLPPQCELMPIVPCGHAKIKGEFRFQFLIKGKLGPILPCLRALPPAPPKIRMQIDVDPLSTFF